MMRSLLFGLLSAVCSAQQTILYTHGTYNAASSAPSGFLRPPSLAAATRKVTAQFKSGLPFTSGITLEVSQGGSIATMSNGQGAVVIMETQYRIVQATMQNTSPTLHRWKVTCPTLGRLSTAC
jgi:hypothetical protein